MVKYSMSFFKRLTNLFSSPSKPSDTAYWVTVRCNRCGEIIRARVDLRNDLSIQYGESDADTTYYSRKLIVGEQRCFQQIEVELTFNQQHQLIDRQIKGGQFVDEDTNK